nr:hypothetical protein [Lachnospiraceae bacterium]
HVAVITKTWGDEVIAIVYNTGDEPAAVDISASDSAVNGMKPVAVLCALSEAGTADAGTAGVAATSGRVLEIPPKSIVYLKIS